MAMMKNFRPCPTGRLATDLNGEREALIWLTEMTIMEAKALAAKRYASKHELGRYISIAQTGMDWIVTFVRLGDACAAPLVQGIIDRGSSVELCVMDPTAFEALPIKEGTPSIGLSTEVERPALTVGRGALTSGRLSHEVDALAYVTECTLATVDGLASVARPTKTLVQRFSNMAQVGVDFVSRNENAHGNFGCGRVQGVIEGGGDVRKWLSARETRIAGL